MRTVVFLAAIALIAGLLVFGAGIHELLWPSPPRLPVPLWQLGLFGLAPVAVGASLIRYRRLLLTEPSPRSIVSVLRWVLVMPAFVAWALGLMLLFLLAEPLLAAFHTDRHSLSFGTIVGTACAFVGVLLSFRKESDVE